jgi:hypothetical protein
MKKLFKDLPNLSNLPAWVGYYSEGDFSLHELIIHVAQFLGKDLKLTVSSFSITEEAVRAFSNLKEDGIISSIRCLFDLNVKMHKLNLMFFGLNIVDEIRLTKNHAKIVIFEGGLFDVVIICTSNLNINDKIEAGIITGDPAFVEFYRSKVNQSIENALKVELYEFD